MYGGGARLSIAVTPEGPSGQALPTQRLMLDSGSSTLAFCDTDVANSLGPLNTGLYACAQYGSAAQGSGFWGNFFKGGLGIGLGRAEVKVTDAYYSVMCAKGGMPCSSTLHGIFGIGFKQLDGASSQPVLWPLSREPSGHCPRTSSDLVQPLMHYLNGQAGSNVIGIAWSGHQGAGEGHLYLNEQATTNIFYNAQAVASMGKAKLGTYGYYNIDVQNFQYGGQSYAVAGCDPQQGQTCIMDTGTPTMVVPQAAYQAMKQGQTGALTVQLAGTNGQPMQLSFDVTTLLQKGWVEPAPPGQIILGLPLWAFYYPVWNIGEMSISFSPMQAHVQKYGMQRNATLEVVV